MLTPLGKKIRKLRIDKEVRLKDMADSLDVTSAFLSALETGKKNVNDNFLNSIIGYFDLSKIAIEEIKQDVINSKTFVKIQLLNSSDQTRELVTAFARNLDSLKSADIVKIKNILSKD